MKKIAKAVELLNGSYGQGVLNARIASKTVECTEAYLRKNGREVEEDEYFVYAKEGDVTFVARKKQLL